MLASTCATRRLIAARVKFLSRVFTALKRLPSMATIASANRSSWRQRAMNWLQAARVAGTGCSVARSRRDIQEAAPLPTIITLNEALHPSPPRYLRILADSPRFHTASVASGRLEVKLTHGRSAPLDIIRSGRHRRRLEARHPGELQRGSPLAGASARQPGHRQSDRPTSGRGAGRGTGPVRRRPCSRGRTRLSWPLWISWLPRDDGLSRACGRAGPTPGPEGEALHRHVETDDLRRAGPGVTRSHRSVL